MVVHECFVICGVWFCGWFFSLAFQDCHFVHSLHFGHFQLIVAHLDVRNVDWFNQQELVPVGFQATVNKPEFIKVLQSPLLEI